MAARADADQDAFLRERCKYRDITVVVGESTTGTQLCFQHCTHQRETMLHLFSTQYHQTVTALPLPELQKN